MYSLLKGLPIHSVLSGHRLVNGYGMIEMIGIPKEYGRYMHQYTYSMHICWYVCMFLLCLPPPRPPYKGIHKAGRPPPLYGGWGGGKQSKNIQTYQQMCIEYAYSCIYIYIYIYPIFLWNPYHPNHPIPNYKPAHVKVSLNETCQTSSPVQTL